MSHDCPCGCGEHITTVRLSCRPSWYRVPNDIRRWVVRAHAVFGERSPEHLASIRAALPYMTGEKL
jgi:hypothetical protein